MTSVLLRGPSNLDLELPARSFAQFGNSATSNLKNRDAGLGPCQSKNGFLLLQEIRSCYGSRKKEFKLYTLSSGEVTVQSPLTKILFYVAILYHMGMEDRCVEIGGHYRPLLILSYDG